MQLLTSIAGPSRPAACFGLRQPCYHVAALAPPKNALSLQLARLVQSTWPLPRAYRFCRVRARGTVSLSGGATGPQRKRGFDPAKGAGRAARRGTLCDRGGSAILIRVFGPVSPRGKE